MKGGSVEQYCDGVSRLVTLAQSKSADEALEREMALKC